MLIHFEKYSALFFTLICDFLPQQKKKVFIEGHNMFLWHQKVLAKHCCAELVENESET